MRRGRLAIGLVLLSVGILLLAASVEVNAGTNLVTIPAGQALEISPTTLTAETVNVDWSQAVATIHVYLVSGTPVCAPSSGVVASGGGSAGSFSASLNPGTTYSLFACSGSTFKSIAIDFTISGGVTTVELLALLSALVGLLFLALAFRRVRTGRVPYDPLAPPRPYVDPRVSAATLGRSVRRSRGPLVRFASPGIERRHGPVEECPGCGRVYAAGRYRSCPGCGESLGAPPVPKV